MRTEKKEEPKDKGTSATIETTGRSTAIQFFKYIPGGRTGVILQSCYRIDKMMNGGVLTIKRTPVNGVMKAGGGGASSRDIVIK